MENSVLEGLRALADSSGRMLDMRNNEEARLRKIKAEDEDEKRRRILQEREDAKYARQQADETELRGLFDQLKAGPQKADLMPKDETLMPQMPGDTPKDTLFPSVPGEATSPTIGKRSGIDFGDQVAGMPKLGNKFYNANVAQKNMSNKEQELKDNLILSYRNQLAFVKGEMPITLEDLQNERAKKKQDLESGVIDMDYKKSLTKAQQVNTELDPKRFAEDQRRNKSNEWLEQQRINDARNKVALDAEIKQNEKEKIGNREKKDVIDIVEKLNNNFKSLNQIQSTIKDADDISSGFSGIGGTTRTKLANELTLGTSLEGALKKLGIERTEEQLLKMKRAATVIGQVRREMSGLSLTAAEQANTDNAITNIFTGNPESIRSGFKVLEEVLYPKLKSIYNTAYDMYDNPNARKHIQKAMVNGYGKRVDKSFSYDDAADIDEVFGKEEKPAPSTSTGVSAKVSYKGDKANAPKVWEFGKPGEILGSKK